MFQNAPREASGTVACGYGPRSCKAGVYRRELLHLRRQREPVHAFKAKAAWVLPKHVPLWSVRILLELLWSSRTGTLPGTVLALTPLRSPSLRSGRLAFFMIGECTAGFTTKGRNRCRAQCNAEIDRSRQHIMSCSLFKFSLVVLTLNLGFILRAAACVVARYLLLGRCQCVCYQCYRTLVVVLAPSPCVL